MLKKIGQPYDPMKVKRWRRRGGGGGLKDEKADLLDIEIVFPNISTKLKNDRTFNKIYVDFFKSGVFI